MKSKKMHIVWQIPSCILLTKSKIFQRLLSLIIIVLLNNIDLKAQSVLYVDSSKSTNGNGSSWSNAFKSLSDALNTANASTTVTEIRIAKGTYYPTSTNNRDATFLLTRANIRILGGYTSGGSTTRNFASHPTILSGNIGNKASNQDNSHHVMVISNVTSLTDSIILDGIIFQEGSARYSASGSATYNGLGLSRQDAAGLVIYQVANNNRTVIKNCIVRSNTAGNAGAGLYIRNSSPLVINSLFHGNYADYGGGIMSLNSDPLLINCTSAGNHDNNGGGGMRSSNSNATLVNCIIYGNDGGYESVNSTNTIFSYCLIQDRIAADTGTVITNINGLIYDPHFVSPYRADTITTFGDYNLKITSPCKNAGVNNNIINTFSIDLSGKHRKTCTIDMGAFEYIDSPVSKVIYVDSATGNDSNTGASWSSPYKTLGFALKQAQLCISNTDSILVAKGTYYPTLVKNGTNRDETFLIRRSNLKIYGGYSTPISGNSSRNIALNKTVLSGELGSSDLSDNSYHVMVMANISGSDSVVVDGFTITGGFANLRMLTNKYNGKEIFRNNGGGLNITDCSNKIALRNCLFTKNRTQYTDNFPLFGSGGAIHIYNSSPYISHCQFVNNYSDGGGAIDIWEGHPTIEYVDFIGNSTKYGIGGGGGGGAMKIRKGNCTVKYCKFLDNSASYGGALSIYSSSSKFDFCEFKGNEAFGGEGGAVDMTYSGIFNTPLIYPEFNNCIFTGNKSSDFDGGTISCAISNISIKNSTIAGNNGPVSGGLTINAGATAYMYNSIIYGNGNAGVFLEDPNNSLLVGSNNLIQGTTSTTIVNSDPLFVDPKSPSSAPNLLGNYRVKTCSPVIDKGSNNLLPTHITKDLDGNNRRYLNTAVDLGAYERINDFKNNARLTTNSVNNVNMVAACDDYEGWTWYGDPSKPDSLSFAIKWGNANNSLKNNAQISIKLENNNSLSSNGTNSATITMRRYWNVSLPNNQSLSAPVSIRFFYNPADTITMRNAILGTNITPLQPLKWFKTNGNTFAPNLVNHGNVNSGNHTVLTHQYGEANGLKYVEFPNVTSLSSGTAIYVTGSNQPLPLSLLSFTAKPIDRSVYLKWQTANEVSILQYDVQKSINGKDWVTINTVKPLEQDLNNYEFVDKNPAVGKNYYRIKTTEHDDQSIYSNIEIVDFKNHEQIEYSIYPNPANKYVNLNINGLNNKPVSVRIIDRIGKVLKSFDIHENGVHELSTDELSSGVYMIQFISEHNKHQDKLLISK